MTLPRPLRLLSPLLFALLLVGLQISACSGGKRCSPENCDTCCNAEGVCVRETSRFACGVQGNVCDSCSALEACVSGTCRSVSGEDGGTACTAAGKCTNPDGTCGDACANGCCDSQGSCQADGLSNTACGSRARQCQACPSGTSCTAVKDGGACLAAQSDVFKPCTTNADCSSLQGGICKLMTTSGNAPYSGGYCTQLCGRTTLPSCPLDSECVGGVDAYGEADVFCWKRCDNSLDCRGGTDYACYWNGPDNLGCWLNPRAAPTGVPGAACTTDSQCGPPPDFNPWCIQATLADGGASGFTGGSCAVDCDISGDEQCGPSGLCTPMREGTQFKFRCQQACTNLFQGQGDPANGGCRTGYVCRGYVQNDGGLEPRGSCVPNCNAPGPGANGLVGCPSGFVCQTSGHCCSTSGCL